MYKPNLQTDAIHNKDLKANNLIGVVFVDLSAAYDTVNIKRLLLKVSCPTKDPGFVHILRVFPNNS